jgi:inner membrane protein
MFKTHVAFGFLAGIFSMGYIHPLNQIVFLALVMFGSALPDIDHPQSKIGRNFKIVGFLFEHRGFFHSFLVIPLIAFGIYYFTHSLVYVLPLGIGYISHLLSDAITREGIMPLHPISRWRMNGLVKTGGAFEYVFFFLVAVLAVYKTINL